MQLTKEQVRARYFACHYDCKIKINDDVVDGNMSGISELTKSVIVRTKDGYCSVDIAGCQLLPRPLSAITDEDALEVAKIAFSDDSGLRTLSGGIMAIINFMFTGMDKPYILDLLRSLGYHTGKFMGYDPIEEGWCIVDGKNEHP